MARNWTPEERQKQALLIHQQKPWLHSTGPKTPEGKNAVKNNAWKHGFDSQGIAELRGLLRIQQGFVKLLMARENARTVRNKNEQQ